MAATSNIEIKLRFLTERLDSIQGSVKELEVLKRQALSTASALKGTMLLGGLTVALRETIQGFNEVKKAIDLGGELSDLSARTGQTVGDLVVLRQAFENAGIGAGATGQLLNLLQKSLTGVNEEGVPTSKAFDRLGVSLESLKSQSAVGQIESLSAAFADIANPADRTRIAMELFGRSGGQMLAVLSDSSAMGVARSQVGSLGETMERNAAAFDKLGDSWDAIGLRMTQLFTGIAEEIGPMLQHVADYANNIDLTKAGKFIGDLVLKLTELGKIVLPVAAALSTKFVLEKTLGKLEIFAQQVAKASTSIVTESAALAANTAAQNANAAARARNAAIPPPASSVPVVTTGAEGVPHTSQSREDLASRYKEARAGGMGASAALVSAKAFTTKGEFDAARLSQTKSILDANARLATLGNVASDTGGKISGMGKVFSGLASGISKTPVSAAAELALPVTIGYTIGDAFQKYGFNWATSLAAGGASTGSDLAAAQERAGSGELAAFFNRANSIKSSDDLAALKQQADAKLEEAQKERKSKWWNQTLDKGVLDGDIAALERFAQFLGKIDPAKVDGLSKAAAAVADATARDAVRADLKEGQRQAGNKARYDALDDRGKLDATDADLKAAQSVMDFAGSETDPKAMEDAAKKILDLTAQRAVLVERIRDAEAQERRDIIEALIAEEKADKEKAERNAATLKGLSDQADLGEAGGDPARLAQVKWQQDYEKALAVAQGAGAGDDAFDMAIRSANAGMGAAGAAAAPGARPTDRLLEIGGFTGGGAAMSQADRSMSAIEKYTSQMASEIKKMVENTKPRMKEEATF
jgi:hypothetical protein